MISLVAIGAGGKAYSLGNDGYSTSESIEVEGRGRKAIKVNRSVGDYATQQTESKGGFARASSSNYYHQLYHEPRNDILDLPTPTRSPLLISNDTS
jgi:hypothetical protein